jgi:MoaA/NifB/PqqE/SkfB family radical SAM enzyme
MKKDIRFAKAQNARVISFSGGEPTVRKELVELVRYASSLGFEIIEIQSNGRMFYYEGFAKDLIDAGTNVFVISLHANVAELHDRQMGVRGAFDQTVKGIKNLKKNGAYVLINIVINKLNYKILPDLTEFLIGLGVNGFHYIFVTADGHAWKNREIIIPKMSQVHSHLLKSINSARGRVKEIWTYNMPFCLAAGYEDTIVEVGLSLTQLRGPDFEASIDENRFKFKTKLSFCKDCKFDNICQGVWKKYLKIFGDGELKPVKGKKIKNEDEFKKIYYGQSV